MDYSGRRIEALLRLRAKGRVVSDDYTLEVDGGLAYASGGLSPRGHRCALAGLEVMAMPAGKVDIAMTMAPFTVNVIPDGCVPTETLRIDGSYALGRSHLMSAGTQVYRPGTELEVVCRNPGWELLIEIDADKLSTIDAESFERPLDGTPNFSSRRDEQSRLLAIMAIDHLRSGGLERLYVEGLGMALTSLALAQLHGAIPPTSTRGTDARIRRAIDYIEAHCGRSLGIAECASVAAMSPSWFARAFRATTGETVHAYVTRRRVERARLLVIGTRRSLGQIAYETGFSDHPHMSRTFKRVLGLSPSMLRDG